MTTPTEQQVYGVLLGTFGYIKAASFTHTLVDKRGHASLLACQLMEWVTDWFRPTKDGAPRFRGVLWLPSAELAARWNVSPRALEDARALISRAGLVTFHSAQHKCWVEVHWDVVKDALAEHKEAVDALNLGSRQNGSLDSDSRQNGSLDSRLPSKREPGLLDSRQNGNIPLLPSSLLSTPPSAGEDASAEGAEGGAQEEGVEAARTSEDELADRLVAYGQARGRRCDGRWAREARAAVAEAVAAGRDPELIEASWVAYVGQDGSARTDLGHWLRGQDLKGNEATDSNTSFVAFYAAAERRQAKKAEQDRVAAGGMPKVRLFATSEGWVVQGEGLATTLVRGVTRDATRAEAEAAWVASWEAEHAAR